MLFWIFNNRISVLNADRIIEPAQRLTAPLKIPKLSAVIQRDRAVDYMVVNMMLVNMSADNKRVPPFCKTLRKLTAKPVCLLRRYLARREGLPKMICNHIVLASHPSGLLLVDLLLK